MVHMHHSSYIAQAFRVPQGATTLHPWPLHSSRSCITRPWTDGFPAWVHTWVTLCIHASFPCLQVWLITVGDKDEPKCSEDLGIHPAHMEQVGPAATTLCCSICCLFCPACGCDRVSCQDTMHTGLIFHFLKIVPLEAKTAT